MKGTEQSNREMWYLRLGSEKTLRNKNSRRDVSYGFLSWWGRVAMKVRSRYITGRCEL